MRKDTYRILFLLAIILVGTITSIQAQSLPSSTAGIVYTYDVAGNRTGSEYVVNNTSVMVNIIDSQKVAVAKVNANVLKVDVLYPNPTTGRFTVRLVKSLSNGTAEIVDMGGRVILKSTESGSVLIFDLSAQPSGVYFLYLQQEQQKITLKILKK